MSNFFVGLYENGNMQGSTEFASGNGMCCDSDSCNGGDTLNDYCYYDPHYCDGNCYDPRNCNDQCYDLYKDCDQS